MTQTPTTSPPSAHVTRLALVTQMNAQRAQQAQAFAQRVADFKAQLRFTDAEYLSGAADTKLAALKQQVFSGSMNRVDVHAFAQVLRDEEVYRGNSPIGKLSTFNFGTLDIARFFKLTANQAEALQRQVLGLEQTAITQPLWQAFTQSHLKEIEKGFRHLAEHPKGSRYGGDFNFSVNIGKMFDRLFTIRPQSFTPGNIARALSSGTTSVGTAGLGTALTYKGESITGQHSRNPLQSAYVGANSFGFTKAGDPKKPEGFLDKIARIGGGAVSALAVGSAAKSFVQKPTATSPLTLAQKSQNFALGTISTTTKGLAFGSVGQQFVQIFGRPGQAILQLLGGDLAGAITTITQPSPSTRPLISVLPPGYGEVVNGGGGGGGSLGISTGSNIGQLGINPVWYLVGGVAIVTGMVWLLRRT